MFLGGHEMDVRAGGEALPDNRVQCPIGGGVGFQVLHRVGDGDRHRLDAWQVFRPRPERLLLFAATAQGGDAGILVVQEPDPLGSVELVGAESGAVDT